MNVTERLAAFVCKVDYERIPSEGVRAIRNAILDGVAVALAGSAEPTGKLMAGLVKKLGGKAQATVIGSGFRSSSPMAALANGTMAHALDYDDMTDGIKGHPTAVLMPAVLAVAEEVKASGREVLQAYALGFEVASKMARAMSPDYFDGLGWHPTGPLLTLGAAAASAKLLHLSQEKTTLALSLAASQASGLRANFGTMTKPFHAGNAARAGILAALLAQEGFTAAPNVLESEAGFCHAFSGGKGYHPERAVQGMGDPFEVISPGLMLKRYPSCGGTHSALDAILHLAREHRIKADDVENVDCSLPFDPPRSLIYDRPKQGLEGKFSMHYCMAAALLDGKISLKTFTTEQVMRPKAQQFLPKVSLRAHPEQKGKPSFTPDYYVVTVKLKNGQQYSHRVDRAIGGERNMTEDELLGKYRKQKLLNSTKKK